MTSSHVPSKYRYTKTIGPVTVERTDVWAVTPTGPNITLILGPTGAGKSTFIEALANDSSLQISSNRLEGCTQSISLYQLKNVVWDSTGDLIYLVDIPGFGDTKISAMSIVSMLKEWMSKNHVRAFSYILYLTPIHIPRLPGSHRQVLRIFQGLIGINVAAVITVVSTMWDSLSSESARSRAESNLKQMRDDIWKDFLNEGSRIVRFLNTQESALSVLDNAFEASISTSYLNVEDFFNASIPLQQTPFGRHLFEDLQNRITNLQLQCSNIRLDIEDASGRSDEQLMTVLRLQLEEAGINLAKFEREIHESGLSCPELVEIVPHARGTASPMSTPVLPAQTRTGFGYPTLTSSSKRRHSFAQVMQKMKCWGKEVGERHEH